jgi:hypothetical protein
MLHEINHSSHLLEPHLGNTYAFKGLPPPYERDHHPHLRDHNNRLVHYTINLTPSNDLLNLLPDDPTYLPYENLGLDLEVNLGLMMPCHYTVEELRLHSSSSLRLLSSLCFLSS